MRCWTSVQTRISIEEQSVLLLQAIQEMTAMQQEIMGEMRNDIRKIRNGVYKH